MKITNSEDDLILVQKIKEDGCSESMEKLIDRHQDLYYSCVHRYHKNHQNSNLSDMLDDIYTVFNYAVKSFKTGKGAKFSTWLAHMSRFHCLNSNKKINNVMSVENNEIDKIHQTQNKYFTFKDNMVEINEHIFYLLDTLDDKRISRIYKYRYMEGGRGEKLMSWSEIGKKLNLSTSHIISLANLGKRFLCSKLSGGNICNKSV